jgi:hypothetical protein
VHDDSGFFNSPLQGESIDVEQAQREASALPSPDRAPFRQAGEFTRMFGAPLDAAAPPPPPPPPVQAGGYESNTAFFASPSAPPPPPVAPVDVPTAPGEYTRMMRTLGSLPPHAVPPSYAPPPQSAASRPSGAKQSVIWAVLAGVGVLVVIVAIALLLRALMQH